MTHVSHAHCRVLLCGAWPQSLGSSQYASRDCGDTGTSCSEHVERAGREGLGWRAETMFKAFQIAHRLEGWGGYRKPA